MRPSLIRSQAGSPLPWWKIKWRGWGKSLEARLYEVLIFGWNVSCIVGGFVVGLFKCPIPSCKHKLTQSDIDQCLYHVSFPLHTTAFLFFLYKPHVRQQYMQTAQMVFFFHCSVEQSDATHIMNNGLSVVLVWVELWYVVSCEDRSLYSSLLHCC